MNRRDFVFSWGRKMFFGFSWPLTSLLFIIYFQSYIFPRTSLEWFFYLTSHFAQSGLITCVLYFLLFCPVIYLLPYYYACRFWGLFLILAANILIFLDATTFAQYGHHLNSFIGELVFQNINLASFIFFILAGSLGLGLFFWFRGDRLWRSMQTHFSNPVKNWYLVIIGLCVVLSHFTFNQKLSDLFPLKDPFVSSQKQTNFDEEKNFNYPAQEIICPGKNSSNFLFLVVDSLSPSEISPEFPMLNHLKQYHASNFTNHVALGLSTEDSLFSFFYGLAPKYSPTSKLPVFFNELLKRNYQLNIFHQLPFYKKESAALDGQVLDRFKEWSTQYKESQSLQPFFNYVFFEKSRFPLAEIDKSIELFVSDLQNKKLLNDTVIVVTSLTGNSTSLSLAKFQVPLFITWSERKSISISHLTTHYDVMPTIMKKVWACKNPPENYSYGKLLSDVPAKDWLIGGSKEDLAVFDWGKKNIILIKDRDYETSNFEGQKISVDNVRKDIVLDALKISKKFYKR
ncbi:MAG: sulfatase-like hydrolase/transferase [Bacteriovoracaceae bacterium]